MRCGPRVCSLLLHTHTPFLFKPLSLALPPPACCFHCRCRLRRRHLSRPTARSASSGATIECAVPSRLGRRLGSAAALLALFGGTGSAHSLGLSPVAACAVRAGPRRAGRRGSVMYEFSNGLIIFDPHIPPSGMAEIACLLCSPRTADVRWRSHRSPNQRRSARKLMGLNAERAAVPLQHRDAGFLTRGRAMFAPARWNGRSSQASA